MAVPPPNEQVATTIADGNDATLGATTDASSASTVVGLLKNLKAALAGILSVKIDQTTAGTTNGVQVNAALPAGTNLLGKVGIDQTTPGTTNAVVLAASTTGAASYAACPAATDTAVKASAGTLLAVMATGTGTAGTVALKDGSTTYLTFGLPAAVTTVGLPLPPSGIAHATDIHVVTTGTGVTAAAAYK